MRNLKALGLTLVAICATSAVTASAAVGNQFHSAAAKSIVTVVSNSTQAFLYETSGRTVECTTVGGSGTFSGQTVSEVTFAPTYSNCKVAGIGMSQAEVSMNGCQYLFTITSTKASGAVHLRCPTIAGVQQQITITVKVFGVSICTYHIGEQTPNEHVDYSNGGVKQITVQPTQTGIVGTKQGSAECGAEKSTSGTYTGPVTVKCEEDGTQTEVACQV